MSEAEFGEVYKRLWASNMWQDKDQHVRNKLLAPNGLSNIKAELLKLLYGSGGISERYDEFRANISGFGPSSLSEILHMVFPEKYCLWNDKPKTVLPFLGLDILPERFFKYQINDGDDYVQCISVLDRVKQELSEFRVSDFIDLDIFFWYIYIDVMPKANVKKPPVLSVAKTAELVIGSHTEAEYHLLELGKLMGFNTYVTKRDQGQVFGKKQLGEVAVLREIPGFAGDRELNSAREVDVIWFDSSENPKMCFEVEDTSDVLRSLNRLYQLEHFNVRFFIVAPDDRRSKFETEMQKFPFRKMRQRYGFVSYDEPASLFETAVPFHELKTKLLGSD
jgi:hypothetical protein